jgi:hypothetical protein
MRASIHFVCEGAEEECLIRSLLNISFFSNNYNVSLENAEGAGNVPILFDQTFSSSQYDAIIVVVDVDGLKTDKFPLLEAKISDTLGFSANQVTFFTNPCTFQLFLASKCGEVLTGKAKSLVTLLFHKYWDKKGKKEYEARTYQLEMVYYSFDRIGAENMMSRISKYSTDYHFLPSTSAFHILSNMKNGDSSWAEELLNKEENIPLS